MNSLKNCFINMLDSNSGKSLVSALHQYGFAILTNHLVDVDLLPSIVTEWKNFFSDGRKFDYVRTDNFDEGYFPLKMESARKNTHPDYKELYQVHYGGKLPDFINVKNTQRLFSNLVLLGEKIALLIDSCMTFNDRDKLSESSKKCKNHILRLIHYPKIENISEQKRAMEHTDIALFTFIFGAMMEGLELQRKDGSWFSLNCKKDSIIVFNAEMLEIYSNGYFKAVNHRVSSKINSQESRYSIPFGFHPSRETKLSNTWIAGQYLAHRLNEMGFDGSKLEQKNY